MKRFYNRSYSKGRQKARTAVLAEIQAVLDLADKIAGPDGTAADVRAGTILSLRGFARLARYLTTYDD